MCHFFLLILTLLFALGSEARAGCPSTPVNWAAADCAVGGVDVCEADGSTWTCDVSTSDSEAQVVTILEDFISIVSWGTHDGELFCCISDENTSFTTVVTLGSEHDDVLAFSYPGGLELREKSGTTMTATIYGGAGNDTIKGSNRDSASYSETLRGEAGIDDIQGNGGDDIIYGGDASDVLDGGPGEDTIYGDAGNDTIFGGPDNDTIEGGPGDDTIRGGDGDDDLEGNAGNDRISGGNGDDTIDGGEGGDVLCGDGESGGDTITDGPEIVSVTPKNLIWGANSLDDITCNAPNTDTDPWSDDYTSSGCNAVLTEKPGQCP